MSELVTQRTILDLIAEYDQKAANIDQAIAEFERAKTAMECAGTIMGTYIRPVVEGGCRVSHGVRANLLQSGWRAIYNRLQIERIASANDKRLFDRAIADPPPLTLENVRATFGPYLENPRAHILRGLAETFAALDPAYRSHSKVKLGVRGLPKRVVIQQVGGYGSYGRDRLRDILNALAAYRGEPLVEHEEFRELDRLCSAVSARAGEATIRGQKLRKFKNGNAHLFFDPEALRDINKGLAEFYGEVLPDVEDETADHSPGTAVSKDLQFYWSPEPVIRAALEFAGIPNLKDWRRNPPEPLRILEPSCGDGRILDALRDYGHRVFGIEYHSGRAAEAAAKGHRVICANFLECPPRAEFDAVVMNPPFYGRHYTKHVRHALKFLKPGARLTTILPASAYYDHRELEGEWRDLPVASFAAAGTNVPTGMLRMTA